MNTDRRHRAVGRFDDWIRGRFVEINTQLENTYAARQNRISVEGVGDELKFELMNDGRTLIAPILDVPGVANAGFDETMELAANVGFYMAACRRHEITEPSREHTSPLVEASTLASHLGEALGMAPRFVASHNQTHNRAVAGRYRTFTARPDELVFLEYNSRSAFAYMRAADALVRLQPMGVSHPVAHDLLADAERALNDALALNLELAEKLDADEFYFCVRPYYKPYRVGSREYRGANAGDFAAFNQIDMILGLCSPTDPSYAKVVLEKRPFLTPEEQDKLKTSFELPSILDELVVNLDRSDEPWFQRNVSAYLRVCDALGALAAHHHDELVCGFIEKPSTAIADQDLVGITASGPPLEVLLRSLEKLRDLRLAADRDDIQSRHAEISTLRSLVRSS